MVSILEKAKEINKKAKTGKILGMTQEELREASSEMKKKKLVSNIKKASEIAGVIASPIAGGVKAIIRSGMRRFNK